MGEIVLDYANILSLLKPLLLASIGGSYLKHLLLWCFNVDFIFFHIPFTTINWNSFVRNNCPFFLMHLSIQLFILAYTHEYLFYFMDLQPTISFFVVRIVLTLGKNAVPFQSAPPYLSTSDRVSPQILLGHLIFSPPAQESITYPKSPGSFY